MDSGRIEGTAKDLDGEIEDAVGGSTGDGKTQAEGKTDRPTGKAQDAYGRAKDVLGAGAMQDPLASFVEDRPVTALLATAGVGYVLSLLPHRRRRVPTRPDPTRAST